MEFRINLSGKRALVTGSTSGIGYAIVKALAEAGASVVLHARRSEHVAGACSRLSQEVPGVTCTGNAADLTDAQAVNRLVAEIPSVDILVHNAGLIRSAPFFELTDEQWRSYADTYILGAVRLARHYARGMIDRNWGRMLFSAGVTCSYTPGDPGIDQMTAWITCKAALLGLARGLAELAAGTNVTVNSFIPGPSPSRESLAARGVPTPPDTFEDFERSYIAGAGRSSLLRRFVRPKEIADLVVFLASDQASGITGAALRVDGGIIRSIL